MQINWKIGIGIGGIVAGIAAMRALMKHNAKEVDEILEHGEHAKEVTEQIIRDIETMTKETDDKIEQVKRMQKQVSEMVDEVDEVKKNLERARRTNALYNAMIRGEIGLEGTIDDETKIVTLHTVSL